MTNTNDKDRRVLTAVAEPKLDRDRFANASPDELKAAFCGPGEPDKPLKLPLTDRSQVETETLPPAS